MGWLGVDLDGTLAEWGEGFNQDVNQIGPPVPRMVALVKGWLAGGVEVRIMTARVCPLNPRPDGSIVNDQKFATQQRSMIEAWCQEHLGQVLPVTYFKDFRMWLLYDDRAVHVEPNTGRICSEDFCVGIPAGPS